MPSLTFTSLRKDGFQEIQGRHFPQAVIRNVFLMPSIISLCSFPIFPRSIHFTIPPFVIRFRFTLAMIRADFPCQDRVDCVRDLKSLLLLARLDLRVELCVKYARDSKEGARGDWVKRGKLRPVARPGLSRPQLASLPSSYAIKPYMKRKIKQY